jgi:D-alanyl-D-alanine-carboxypeptidase/D-alanyl-D-alanine-endopeptidase
MNPARTKRERQTGGRRVPSAAAMGGQLEQLVDREGSRGHDALVAGVLVHGTSTIHGWRRDTPPPDERTLFEIGSLTKPFTGVLLADMCLRGEVQFDDPVAKYLPDAYLPRWKGRLPTLEELATHRAALPNAPRGLGRKEAAFALGLRSGDPWADVDTRAYHEFVRRTAARRPPGGRVRYSSLGFGLLGDALADRAGVAYEQLLQDRILSPLGLLDTAISVPPDKRPRLLEGRSGRGRPRPPLRDQLPAAGAIRSSANDLLHFLACTLTPPKDAPGLALTLATQPRVQVNARLGIGLGWMVLRRKHKPELIWHSGGTWGFRSFAAMIPGAGSAWSSSPTAPVRSTGLA